jgi:amyloid beta precursor protein binding protein 1
MKAQSADYIQLQNIYKTKARQDIAEVLSTVRTLESSLHRSQPIDTAEVGAFCKNAAHIKLVRGRPFHITAPDRKLVWGERAKAAGTALEDESSLILLYIAFLAWDEFYATHFGNTLLSAPGAAVIDIDAARLTGIAHRILSNLIAESGVSLDEEDDVSTKVGEICAELVRARGAEMHNTAALAGGLVAQEVIKVVTRQYIPVDNTCLFDGIRSLSSVLRL